MSDFFKIEGRLKRIEIRDGTLNAFNATGDSQIIASAALGSITEGIALSAQSVYLATRSRLNIQSVVMELDNKILVGQFHKVLFKLGEYLICILKRLNDTTYEVLSVLSPESGLLHMQVGMGESLAKHKVGVQKEKIVWYAISMLITGIVIFTFDSINLKNITILFISGILFYFIFSFIIKKASDSLESLLESSEEVFKLYGFNNPQNLSLLKNRYLDNENSILLESVYEYRKSVSNDPYPKTYILDKGNA